MMEGSFMAARSNRRKENKALSPPLSAFSCSASLTSLHIFEALTLGWLCYSTCLPIFDLFPSWLTRIAIDFFCPACMQLCHYPSHFGSWFDGRAKKKPRQMFAEHLNDCCRTRRMRATPSFAEAQSMIASVTEHKEKKKQPIRETWRNLLLISKIHQSKKC